MKGLSKAGGIGGIVFILFLASFLFRIQAVANQEDCTAIEVDGSVVKICQLLGDYDLDRKQPTLSLTWTKYGVAGTDLGVSFKHGGKLIFLFGDTVGRKD